MTKINLIATGGTLDKHYSAITGTLDVDDPVLHKVLADAGVGPEELTVSSFLRKDSLDITPDERADLAEFVASAPASRVLITHGTDTMGETAELIARLAPGKTVVLTGAMVPYKVESSDAAFNIGFAYAAVQLLPPGVYIAMHGRVLPHAQYRKVREIGRFVPSK